MILFVISLEISLNSTNLFLLHIHLARFASKTDFFFFSLWCCTFFQNFLFLPKFSVHRVIGSISTTKIVKVKSWCYVIMSVADKSLANGNMTLYYTDHETSLILLKWCYQTRWIQLYDASDFKSKCILLLQNTVSSVEHFECLQLSILVNMYKSYTKLPQCARMFKFIIFSTNRDAPKKPISGIFG